MEVKNGLDSAPGRPRRSRHLLSIVFFLILAGVSLLLHLEKKHRFEEIRKAKEHFVSLAGARPLDQVKAKRVRFYMTRFYLGYPMSVSYAAADLILRLNGIVRPLRLLEIQIDPGLHDLKFKLSVGIEAAVPDVARRKFAVFFEKLRNFPGVTQASFSVPDRAGGGDEMHAFSIHGQVEWQ